MLAPSEVKHKLADLQREVAGKLVEIEDVVASHGLAIGEYTLIARNPKRPGMILVFSSEKDGGAEAIDAAAREMAESSSDDGNPGGPGRKTIAQLAAEVEDLRRRLGECEFGPARIGG